MNNNVITSLLESVINTTAFETEICRFASVDDYIDLNKADNRKYVFDRAFETAIECGRFADVVNATFPCFEGSIKAYFTNAHKLVIDKDWNPITYEVTDGFFAKEDELRNKFLDTMEYVLFRGNIEEDIKKEEYRWMYKILLGCGETSLTVIEDDIRKNRLEEISVQDAFFISLKSNYRVGAFSVMLSTGQVLCDDLLKALVSFREEGFFRAMLRAGENQVILKNAVEKLTQDEYYWVSNNIKNHKARLEWYSNDNYGLVSTIIELIEEYKITYAEARELSHTISRCYIDQLHRIGDIRMVVAIANTEKERIFNELGVSSSVCDIADELVESISDRCDTKKVAHNEMEAIAKELRYNIFLKRCQDAKEYYKNAKPVEQYDSWTFENHPGIASTLTAEQLSQLAVRLSNLTVMKGVRFVEPETTVSDVAMRFSYEHCCYDSWLDARGGEKDYYVNNVCILRNQLNAEFGGGYERDARLWAHNYYTPFEQATPEDVFEKFCCTNVEQILRIVANKERYDSIDDLKERVWLLKKVR